MHHTLRGTEPDLLQCWAGAPQHVAGSISHFKRKFKKVSMQESIRQSILIFREGLDLKGPRVLGLCFPPLGFYFYYFYYYYYYSYYHYYYQTS